MSRNCRPLLVLLMVFVIGTGQSFASANDRCHHPASLTGDSSSLALTVDDHRMAASTQHQMAPDDSQLPMTDDCCVSDTCSQLGCAFACMVIVDAATAFSVRASGRTLSYYAVFPIDTVVDSLLRPPIFR